MMAQGSSSPLKYMDTLSRKDSISQLSVLPGISSMALPMRSLMASFLRLEMETLEVVAM